MSSKTCHLQVTAHRRKPRYRVLKDAPEASHQVVETSYMISTILRKRTEN